MNFRAYGVDIAPKLIDMAKGGVKMITSPATKVIEHKEEE
jgi:hypothetical protein